MEVLIQTPIHKFDFINVQNEIITKSHTKEVIPEKIITDSILNISKVTNQYNDVATIFDNFPIAAKHDVQLFIDKIPVKQRVSALDLGCGTGRTVIELSKHFDNVTGIDISSSMIEFAKQKCKENKNTNFYNGDIRNLNLISNSFDYIVSHTTFHHLDKDLIPTLKVIKELLRPKGKIVVIDILAQGVMKNNAPLVRKIGASITFIKELPKLGFKKALENFNNATHPSWMEHLNMDRFLSKKEFIQKFNSVFNGAKYSEFTMEYGMNHLILMEWTKSET